MYVYESILYHLLQLGVNNEKITPGGNHVVSSRHHSWLKNKIQRDREHTRLILKCEWGRSYREAHIGLIKNNCMVLELESLHGEKSPGHCCFS